MPRDIQEECNRLKGLLLDARKLLIALDGQYDECGFCESDEHLANCPLAVFLDITVHDA